MQNIKLKLLTPDKPILECDAEMVVLPGVDGEFGVLYGHMQMVSLLKQGILKIYSGKKIIDSVFISSGVAEILSGSCHVMVGGAIHGEKATVLGLQKQIIELKEQAKSLEEVGMEKSSLIEKIKFFEHVLELLHE